MLSDLQIERYSRHILVPQIGGVGQEKLLVARVAILGVGDTARTAATYLIAAGIGAVALGEKIDDLVDEVDGDCRISRIADAGTEEALRESVSGCQVIISTQTNAQQLASVAQIAEDQSIVLIWGSDAGTWAVVRRHEATGAPVCSTCLIEAAADNDNAAAFWAGSQLATAAIAAIVGLSLPHGAQRFDDVRGLAGNDATTCTHGET